MINNSVLMGRLCDNPEMKQTPGGINLTSFTIAVERSYKSGDERKADYIDCVAWRNEADHITKWFHKGDLMAVVGELQTRTYEDKNNMKHKVTELLVLKHSFCGGRNKTEEAPAGTVPQSQEVNLQEIPNGEDLPF